MSIQTIQDSDSLILKIAQSIIKPDVIRESRELARSQPLMPVVVLDFSKVDSVSLESLPDIVQMATELESRGSRLMILLHQDLANSIEQHTSELLPSYLMVSGQKTDKTEKLDPSIVHTTILNSLAKTLETYVHVSPQIGGPLRPKSIKLKHFEIGATLDIKADSLKISVALSFPKETYLKLMSRIQGKKYKIVAPQIKDWAAELLNVTFGLVKTFMNDRNHNLSFNIPKVVGTRTIQLFHQANDSTWIFPLKTDEGTFYFSIVEIK